MDTTATKPTLVIARHQENIDWAKDYKHVVIQKGKDMPNIGLEVGSFLHFIVSNYDKLKGEYIFVQGNPFDHYNPLDGKERTTFECKPDGTPHHPNLPIHSICKELDLPILEAYEFNPGGQFKTNSDTIKKRPWEWYVKALHLSLVDNNPWVFERLWNYIMK